SLVVIPVAWFFGLLSFQFMLAYFSLVALYGVFPSMMALVMAELVIFKTTRKRDMVALALAAIGENFGYRQLNLLWRIEGIWQFFRKKKGWGEMTRVGHGARRPPGGVPPGR
ncbi:MAG: glycosyltransferase family 2 protein, partial [Opitutae bacterium]|nr:glycosyltransferase family 2 protein [Opitutae bacterium]